jgi:hypothetical protein
MAGLTVFHREERVCSYAICVLEGKILRRIFGRKAKQQGNDENYITRIFIICIPHLVL